MVVYEKPYHWQIYPTNNQNISNYQSLTTKIKSTSLRINNIEAQKQIMKTHRWIISMHSKIVSLGRSMRLLFIYISKTNRYCCILQCTYDEASELDMEAMLAALIDGLGGRTSCERWIQPAEARFLPDVGAPPSSNITSHLNQSTIPLIYLSLCIHYISFLYFKIEFGFEMQNNKYFSLAMLSKCTIWKLFMLKKRWKIKKNIILGWLGL